MRLIHFLFALLLTFLISLPGNYNSTSPEYFNVSAQCPINNTSTRFAVIGDFGYASQPEQDVANLVKSWSPQFVLTTGDNNYPSGSAATIDANIGQYYHEFISPYIGTYGQGASNNRFFPTLGNHDWDNGTLTPYLDYFTLPDNERYYDFVRGPIHFFVLDSDTREPDGITSNSLQAQWLKTGLATSTAPWKLVFMHHAPYSSALHGSNSILQWPFRDWGASAVIAGHDHAYERIIIPGQEMPYFVNGLGGRSIYNFSTPINGSQLRYNGDYGAMRVEAGSFHLSFSFINRAGVSIDNYILSRSNLSLANPTNLSATLVGNDRIDLSWTNNSNNETGFCLERRRSSSPDWVALPFTPGNGVTTYSDTNLAPYAVYYYRVQAYNANGYSGYSNQSATVVPSSTTIVKSVDDGSPGTLSFILANANPGDLLAFAPDLAPITFSGVATLPPLKPGILLLGICGLQGPKIIIDGSGIIAGEGLELQGNNTIHGTKFIHFNGRQIYSTGKANSLSCLQVAR